MWFPLQDPPLVLPNGAHGYSLNIHFNGEIRILAIRFHHSHGYNSDESAMEELTLAALVLFNVQRGGFYAPEWALYARELVRGAGPLRLWTGYPLGFYSRGRSGSGKCWLTNSELVGQEAHVWLYNSNMENSDGTKRVSCFRRLLRALLPCA